MLALRRDLSMSKYMRDPVRAHVGFAANMFNKMSMQCTLLCICVYMVPVMHICAGVTRFPFGVPHFIDTNHNLRNPSYHIFSGCHDIVFEEVESRYIKPGHRVWIEKPWDMSTPGGLHGI